MRCQSGLQSHLKAWPGPKDLAQGDSLTWLWARRYWPMTEGLSSSRHAPPHRAAEHPHNVVMGFPQGERERGEGREIVTSFYNLALSRHTPPFPQHPCWSHSSLEGCLGCQLWAATLIFISQAVTQKHEELTWRRPRLSASGRSLQYPWQHLRQCACCCRRHVNDTRSRR